MTEPAKTTKPRVEPVVTAIATPVMPERSNKRGSVSLYPFDSLTAVGQAFGVKNKTAANLASIVSNANRKAMVQETDASGAKVFDTKEIADEAGNKTTVPDTSKPKMVASKHFFAHDVDVAYAKTLKGTPLEGSSVLIFRDK